MSRRIDLNTKLRLSVEDLAYALSIAKSKAIALLENSVIIPIGGKVATKDVIKLVNRIYSPDFPNNIADLKHRKILIEVFCNEKDKYNFKKEEVYCGE